MKKLPSTLPFMLLSLTLISALAAALLSFVHKSTFEAIEKSKTATLEKAISEVTPEFDNSPILDMKKVLVDADSLTVYPAKKDGQIIGTAVRSVSHKAFSGDITVLYGFDIDGNVIQYSVLEMQETPGLGSKMTDWFKTEKGQQSILGKSMSEGELKVKQDQGDVDAITAATISSRAFLDAANRAYKAHKEYLSTQNVPQ